jgi:hypothetical protein
LHDIPDGDDPYRIVDVVENTPIADSQPKTLTPNQLTDVKSRVARIAAENIDASADHLALLGLHPPERAGGMAAQGDRVHDRTLAVS